MSGKMSPALVVGIVVAVILATVGAYLAYSYLGDDDGGDANKAPVASFTFSPSEVQVGDSVSFDASASSDADGTVASYSWNLGDSTVGTGMTVTHAFLAAGNYTVRLTVTDDEGATGTAMHVVEVLAIPAEDGFTIDGLVADWGTRTVFADGASDGSGVDLDEYSLHRATSKLFLFASSAADLPSDAEPTALLVLLDTDGNAATGYSARGIGADYLLEARYASGAADGLDVLRHTGDGATASGFAKTSEGTLAVTTRTFEGSVPLASIGTPAGASIKALFLLQHDGGEDVADHVVTPGKGALSVSIQTTAVNPVQLGEEDVLRVTLRATGDAVSVSSLDLSLANPLPQGRPVCGIHDGATLLAMGQYLVTDAYSFDFASPVVVADGGVRALDVNATFYDSLVAGLPFGLSVSAASDVACDGTVWVATPTSDSYYLVSAPATPTLDGCRGDLGYASATDADDAAGTDVVQILAGRDVDIVTWGVRAQDLMRGVTLPTEYLAGSASFDGTGADTLTLYFDMDGSSATGMAVSGIGADFRVVIRGRGGVVLSATESTWSGGTWGAGTDSYVKLNGGYAEGGFQYLGGIASPRMAFESADWFGTEDGTATGLAF